MAMSTLGMSTSFPSSTPQWKYDVFLSFRGEDTRKGFTDHLYTALEQQGIITFKDDPELPKGRSIAPELLTAIEESRFALIILSRNYASSTWCLDELLKILECMEARKTVIPVFYDVDPSNVRKQTGSFAEAFIEHEKRFRDDTEKVKWWRSALTKVANFSGWNSNDCYESKLIKDIVEDIWTKLGRTLFSNMKNLVGIDSRLEPINMHLGVGENDVRFIGIWGMGGIGKTTVAKVVYARISHEFEVSFLLTNVRNSVEKSGLDNLQKQLLSGIWMKKDAILDLDQGATIMNRFLRHKKVLLILDDVNHLDQLKYLAGNQGWFGLGSRVLITTRNERLLVEHGVERRVKIEGLDNGEALQLFSWNAFKKQYPEQNYLVLSKCVVNYASGLPLALEVLGSFLHRRGLSEWNCALRKLGKVCNSEIFDILKISYDGLDDEEKKIFLDIACFFNGEYKDHVIKILTACDLSAIIGINVLIERSLLTVLYGRLQMHDSLQEMGQEIVIRDSPNELGRRSRLWLCEDANYVLSKNTGTEILEGIILKSTDGPRVNVDVSAFSMMNKLRYLKINNASLSNELEYLPNSLRILDWVEYPLKSFPSHFNLEKLIELNLCNSCIKNFHMGIKPLYNLKAINLSHSLNLVSIPNFESMPNLELLILEGCIQLHEVDQSIGVLERLTLLNLKDCKNLVGLPICGLKSLKVLNISGCSKVHKLPNDLGDLDCLEELDVSGTAIRELPSSIGMLQRLTLMKLIGCKHLVRLPISIYGLKSLEVLDISGCSKIKLPVEYLEELDVGNTTKRELPSSFGFFEKFKDTISHGCEVVWGSLNKFLPFGFMQRVNTEPMSFQLPLSGLCNLTNLNLSNCNLGERAFPNGISCLPSLVKLDLSGNNFVLLPSMVRSCFRLEFINLENCTRLQELSGLPTNSSLNKYDRLTVRANGCSSLEMMFDASNFNKWEQSHFYFTNCFKINDNIAFEMLKTFLGQGITNSRKTFRIAIPGSEVPEWFSHRSVGDSVSVKVPPGWNNSGFMGYALCAVFVLHEYHLSDHTYPATYLLGCCLKFNGINHLYPAFRFSEEFCQVASDHLWLQYISHHRSHTSCSEIEFFFQTGGRGLKVKKCGVHLIYEQDVQELNQIMTQSSISPETFRQRQSNSVSISEKTLEIFSDCTDFEKAAAAAAVPVLASGAITTTKRGLEQVDDEDDDGGAALAGPSKRTKCLTKCWLQCNVN